MYDNIVRVRFGGSRSAIAPKRTQYDRNQILVFTDLELPDAYPVHFSNRPVLGETKTQIGTTEGVLIPDEFFWSGATAIYAFLYLHLGTGDETVYTVTIPLNARPRPSDVEPTPAEADVIAQTIAALNNGVSKAETAAASASQSETNAAQSSSDAQTAQQAAEAARDRAEQARDDAAESAVSAAGSAGSAEGSAIAAAQSATNAAGSAADAYLDAERAEQAAAESGYMYVYIDDDGYIVYERTPNTNIDLSIDEDGYICMEAIG